MTIGSLSIGGVNDGGASFGDASSVDTAVDDFMSSESIGVGDDGTFYDEVVEGPFDCDEAIPVFGGSLEPTVLTSVAEIEFVIETAAVEAVA